MHNAEGTHSTVKRRVVWNFGRCGRIEDWYKTTNAINFLNYCGCEDSLLKGDALIHPCGSTVSPQHT